MGRRIVVWAPLPSARYPRWLVPALERDGRRVRLDAGRRPPRGRCEVAYVPPGVPRPPRAKQVVAVLDERPALPAALDADAVLVPVHALVDAARELAPALPVRVVAPHAAATPHHRRAAASAPDDPPRIVCAAPLDWRAGHEPALLALSALRAAGVPARLDVLGDGPLRDAVLYTVADLGLGDAVTVGPAVGRSELRRRLAGASAFVLAAVTDAVWAEPLEALAAGVPVVTSDVPALRELLGASAVLVPPRDPDAIAAALAGVLAPPPPATVTHEPEDGAA